MHRHSVIVFEQRDYRIFEKRDQILESSQSLPPESTQNLPGVKDIDNVSQLLE